MKKLLGTIPFTLVGVAILAFYEILALLPDSAVRASLLGVARVLIVPSYLVWLALAVLVHTLGVSFGGIPATLGAFGTTLLGLIPYAAADWILSRYRRSRAAAA